MTGMRIVVEARAKINWSLGITQRRADGYHELDMLMQPIALADTLTFESARRLILTVDGAPLPVNDRNLVVRAAHALCDAVGQRRGARIQLVKRIPSRAGLGGGSADCAAALKALNRLWNLRLPMSALMSIGLSLGADVPFCLSGGLCRVGGIGEKLTPLGPGPRCALVLVTPGGGLSTPQVFSEWDALGGAPQPGRMDDLARALSAGSLAEAERYAFNALEPPAIGLMPEIGRLIERFRALGAPFVRMTGSGSTVFAAFDDYEAAQRAAAAVPGAILTETCTDDEQGADSR